MSSMFIHDIVCLRTSLPFILLQFPTSSLADMRYLSVMAILSVASKADMGGDWTYTEHPSLQ